ncbi:hypothetical protein L249_4108, partial [Ophiocordyceps polyrhachis-furcata BCC 54312]
MPYLETSSRTLSLDNPLINNNNNNIVIVIFVIVETTCSMLSSSSSSSSFPPIMNWNHLRPFGASRRTQTSGNAFISRCDETGDLLRGS